MKIKAYAIKKKGRSIDMKMVVAFYGDYFGSFTDKFGIK